jgi:hypothetical protein
MNHLVQFFPASHCRASGVSLTAALLIFELTDCPFPKVYRSTVKEASLLRSPLRVAQARRESGLAVWTSLEAGIRRRLQWHQHRR